MFAYFVFFLVLYGAHTFLFCNALILLQWVLWTGSVVYLLYDTVYNSMSCARLERVFWLKVKTEVVLKKLHLN